MIKPLDKNVLIKKYEPINVLGIYMPQSSTNLYEVINVGINVNEVKVNNKVIIDNKNAKEVNHNGITYYLLKEEDILGVVEE